LGISVIDVASYNWAPEAIDETDSENKSADECRIDFQYRSQVEHQIAGNCLKYKILRKVARAKTDALKPTKFVEAIRGLQ
jgi:hypothetical protein